LNVSEEQNKFKNIEKSFFAKNGKWTMFTRSAATETTLPASLGAKNWKVYQVSISKNELRKYLEEQKIIKSLTNGF
jgi:mRNA deadenylase 3'-5' endonuclease subunit Ccr4